VGQVYNLTDGEAVSKRRFVGKIADAIGLPHPHLMPPYWLAFLVTWCIDKAARLRGAKRAPEINFTRLKFLGLNLDFSIEKARTELGYRPRWSFDDGMVETLDWYKKRQV
jgi:2-alkyl-3-oxoalkanoate reductase